MSLYLKIDGLDAVTGAASLKEIAGKKGFMNCASFAFGASRPMSLAVGGTGNADSGSISLSEITIDRKLDGGSPYLQTFFLAPGDKGRKVELFLTKPDRSGNGQVPSLNILLEEVRVSGYQMTGADAGDAEEHIMLFYTNISIVHYHEDAAGKIVKGETVKYNLSTSTVESMAKF